MAKYEVASAAALVAGVTRMTVSLAAIVIESTGNVGFGLPVMLALVVAKLVGDCFNQVRPGDSGHFRAVFLREYMTSK